MEGCCSLEPPAWALRLVAAGEDHRVEEAGGIHARVRWGERFALTSAVIDDARTLDAEGFRTATVAAYDAIAGALEGRRPAAPVRMWNFVPGILEPLGSLRHRYMVFNTGRYEAFLRRYDSPEEMARHLPTASGVGHRGSALAIHCLAAIAPGRSIENPRQVDAHRYSADFGPHPPCFARATLLETDSATWLLVGGTASVVGEASRHHGDVDRQLDETIRNLVSVADAARGETPIVPREVRVYYVRADDLAFLKQAVPERMPGAELEFVPAELCRPELLVEIEARYDAPSTVRPGTPAQTLR